MPPATGCCDQILIHPGRRYRLPLSARTAVVMPRGRDLVLCFESGGQLLLEDLITIEAMAHPPVFELGERGVLASVIGALVLAQGGGGTLDQLIAASSDVMVVCGNSFYAALSALISDGILPQAIFQEFGPL